MSRRFDTRTTIFSPEGRLYQVEYAMEAISHAGTCLGILAKDGVVIAAERRNTSKLLDDTVMKSEKMYKLNDDIACSVAGITADANVLINQLRTIGQRHEVSYGEPIPLEQMVRYMCDLKQAYTQFGGMRPFGVSILYMGWDKVYGYQLYQSDPSGNYGGWKATCVGHNATTAMNLLKQEFDEEKSDLKSALTLAVKVMAKTMDTAKLTTEKMEIATLSREDGRTKLRLLPFSELERLLKEYDAEEAKSAAEKKEKDKEAKRRMVKK